MKLGNLTFIPIEQKGDLVAPVVLDFVHANARSDDIFVAKINSELADTTAFCKQYGIDLAISANCLIIEAKRVDRTWYAACLVLATDVADVNGIIRKKLDARKTSFAPMDAALQLTKMEYGGITPLGLPDEWPILVDEAVMKNEYVVVGAGIRGSKIALKTNIFPTLQNTSILKIAKS